MPLTFSIDPDRGLIHTLGSGVLTIDELVALKRAIVEHPDFRPDLAELSDVRSIEGIDFEPYQMGMLLSKDIELAEKFGPGYRMALVIADDFVFDMGRGYQHMSASHGPDVAIFRDMRAAEDWLGLD